MTNHATSLHDAGFIVVPIPPLQKSPKARAWGKSRPTREHLANFYDANPTWNIGVLLGREADLVDIEGDGEDSEEAIRALFDGEPPETFIAHSRRGVHRFFRWDERLAPLPGKIDAPPLEIRLGHTGQFQSLVCGTVDYGGDSDFSRTYKLRPVATLPASVIDKILMLSPARTSTPVVKDDWFDDMDKPSPARVFSALASLKPSRANTYDEWLKIGMALRSLGDDYFGMFDGWARTSNFYGQTKEKWASFKPRENGVTIGTLFHFATEDGWHSGTTAKPAADPPRQTFRLITSRELANTDFKVEFLIEDILVAGQPTLCGGNSKVLKTSICVDAAISLASGAKFLGRFPVLKKCKTLIMSGESGLPVLKETARRICKSKGIRLEDLDNLVWSDELPECSTESDLLLLTATLTAGGFDVVFIDPAYLCLGGDEHGNVFMQGQRLRRLQKACNGASLILVHHNTKKTAKSRKPPELEDMSMAGFSEFARQWWLLGRRESYEPGQPHELWLSIGGSAGHSGLYELTITEGTLKDPGGRIWEVLCSDHFAKKCRDEINITKVLDLLRENPQGLYPAAIAKTTGLTKDHVKVILTHPDVVPCKVPHPQSRTKTIDGYKLVQKDQAA
jgi:hypothetical protein